MGKTCYHSELVKLSPVQVTVKSEVTPSKFKGKEDYVILKIDGEDRTYPVENEECAGFFEGLKGRTFTLIAEGSREEATLSYAGESAGDEPPEEEPRKPVRPPKQPIKGRVKLQHPPPAKPLPQQQKQETAEDRVMRTKGHANQMANLYLVAFGAARFVRSEVERQFGEKMTAEHFQACCATISIQLCKDDYLKLMPLGQIEVVKHDDKEQEEA